VRLAQRHKRGAIGQESKSLAPCKTHMLAQRQDPDCRFEVIKNLKKNWRAAAHIYTFALQTRFFTKPFPVLMLLFPHFLYCRGVRTFGVYSSIDA
jgi:hypothetical protein